MGRLRAAFSGPPTLPARPVRRLCYNARKERTGLEMTTFDVKGMTCGHCVRAVTEAVRELDAQAGVEIDLAAGTVRVEATRPTASIARAIEQAGYETKARAG